LWIEIEKINNAPGAVAVLYELIRSCQFNYEQADLIIRGLPGRPGRLFYSSTHVLNIDRNHLIISPVKNREETEELAIEKEVREVVFGAVRLSFEVISIDDVSFGSEKKIAMLDYDALHFPLLIRKWRYGDFFVPLGMRGKKKLSDFMIDEKIPVNLKTDVLVLLSEGQVAWVVNHRIDERFKVNAKTKRILKIISNAHD
jgi:tRNA(Ile)-lysidine synthase